MFVSNLMYFLNFSVLTNILDGQSDIYIFFIRLVFISDVLIPILLTLYSQ